MPRQNRVTPFGELIATPERGTLMGNRGLLHDAEGRIRRQFALRRWIACVLVSKGPRRTVMSPGQYTELFFLDEATALAAGHRPCAACRWADYVRFRTCWAGKKATPSAEDIDRVLHAERLDGLVKRLYTERLDRLPDGVMVANDGQAWLVRCGKLRLWSPAGYGPTVSRKPDEKLRVLTPRSIVRAVAAGYPVALHPSAEEA